jgi:hypothetical protein
MIDLVSMVLILPSVDVNEYENPGLGRSRSCQWEAQAASKLGAAVDIDGLARDPARSVGCQERHHRGDVVRLGHAL